MTKTTEEFGFYTEQLSKKPKTNSLKQKMQNYIDDYKEEGQKKERPSGGKKMSEIVIEGREERV
jgi:hypothetical protein